MFDFQQKLLIMKKLLLFIFLLTFSLGQSQTPAAGPSLSPARNAWDVKSQYGNENLVTPNPNAYATIPNIIFDSFGGSTIVGDVTLADDSKVKKYTGHSYSGISANSNVTGLFVANMTHLHIDVWSPDFASFKIKLEAMNGSNVELEVPGAKVQNSWNSYDIDLSTYAGVDLTNLKWIVPVTFGPNNTTLFIANVYFYRPATTQPPTIDPFTIAPQLVGSPNFTITPPVSNSNGAFSYTSSNTSVAQIVNGNEIQIMGAGSSTIIATQSADGGYGSGTASAVFIVTPDASQIPPARNPGYVVSMFTGTPTVYANAVNAIRAPWTAGTTLTTIPNGTNTCLQLDNFGYLGYITDGANFSVAGMSKLHVDIYLNAPLANMFIVLLAPNDNLYNTGPLVAGWNSLDITLATAFPAANLTNIYGIKFEKNIGAPATIFLDNIYFYLEANQPLLSNFSVPSQPFGSPNFTITPPTSNSNGAFTYTSSNTNVAQIVNGNQIQIMNGGSSIITANQAADGPFVAGTIAATFVATFPAPGPSPIPPARPAENVVSMFTGTPPVYANAVNSIRAPWSSGATTLTTIPNGTDTCLQIDNLGFMGYITDGANFSVVGKTKVHLDIYVNAPMANLFVFLLSNGDQLYNTGQLNAGWNSRDLTLATTFPGANLASIYGFKFEQNVGPPTQIYLDNIYFYVSNSEPTLTNFSIPTQPAGAPDFTITPPTSNSPGTFSYFSANTNVATIVNGNEIHIVGGGSSLITATQAAAGGFDAANISTTFVVTFAPPIASPIPPTRDANDVFSMFTGTPSVYANPVGFNMVRSDWTAATTLTTIPNGTNTCLKVDNFGYLGYVTNTEPVRFSVAGMTKLHVDIYLNEPTSNMMIFLLTNGDQLYNTGPLAAGWNPIDIDLSSFVGANLTNVYGFKFEQNVASPYQMYLDNIYFWKPSTKINLKLFVQGYYEGSGSMASVQNNQDFPDYSLPQNTNVEMITVELHDATTIALVASTTAMLHTDGTAVCTFPTAPSGSFYIAVKTRNTVQTWSKFPQTVGLTPLTYDFTSAASQAYDDNQIDLGSGVFGFISGDINSNGAQDDEINPTDYSEWESDSNAFLFGSYATDLNGDGEVNPTDYSIWEANANEFRFALYPTAP